MIDIFNIYNIAGSSCSIISFFLTILMYVIKTDKKGEKGKRAWWGNWLYSLLFLVICASFVLSFYLLVESDSNNKGQRFWYGILFIFSIVSFLLYALKATESLDGKHDNILPPKILWQMLLNKVPSEIEVLEAVKYNNNNLDEDIFAYVYMDDGLKKAGDEIENCYKEKTDFKVKEYYGYKKEGEEYVFEDLNELLTNKCIRGVLFLVGEPVVASKKKELKECISAYARRHKANPIICYWASNEDYNLPYDRIIFEDLGRFVKILAARGYYRNFMQIDLGRSYRKTFIIQGIFLLLLSLGLICLSPKLNDKNGTAKIDKQKGCIMCDSIIDMLRDSVNFSVSTAVLDNSSYFHYKPEQNIFEGLDTALFIQDTQTVEIIEKFSNYYFSDIEGFKGVKLWYVDNIGAKDSRLMRLLASSNKNDNSSKVLDNKYMIWYVMKHRIFFLWPGECNIEKDDYYRKNNLAWRFKGDDDISNAIEGEIHIINDTTYNWIGWIRKEKADTILWHSTENSSNYIIYGFSFDGHLAVEIDFKSLSKDSYKYLSHLIFRNSVRKYMYLVTGILSHPRYKIKTEETSTGTIEVPLNE